MGVSQPSSILLEFSIIQTIQRAWGSSISGNLKVECSLTWTVPTVPSRPRPPLLCTTPQKRSAIPSRMPSSTPGTADSGEMSSWKPQTSRENQFIEPPKKGTEITFSGSLQQSRDWDLICSSVSSVHQPISNYIRPISSHIKPSLPSSEQGKELSKAPK